MNLKDNSIKSQKIVKKLTLGLELVYSPQA